MKLFVLTPSKTSDVNQEALIASKLFELGLETFHVRKPRYSTKELSNYLEKIPARFHNRVVIHSHHNLALKYNLKGIHLTHTHLKKKIRLWINLKLIRFKKPNITVSTSFRKLASLYEEENAYHYVFLSPIYDSISGKFQAGFNEHSLKAAINKTPFKIIARGGVDGSKIENIVDIGFDGLILNSSLWSSKDPVQFYIDILNKFKELNLQAE
jgi:thiamine-phosphate pyrophosphorylase